MAITKNTKQSDAETRIKSPGHRLWRRGDRCFGQDLPWKDHDGVVVYGLFWNENRVKMLEHWRNNPMMQDLVLSLCDERQDHRWRACLRVAKIERQRRQPSASLAAVQARAKEAPTAQDVERAREIDAIWSDQRHRLARILGRPVVRSDGEALSVASLVHLVEVGALPAWYAIPDALRPPAGQRSATAERVAAAEAVGREWAR
jgi:hypothetical protein